MRDGFGRRIDYLRVSITDRCNLRCRYCMPTDLPHVPHEQILRYEEILRVCGIAGELGVHRFRVTGGEPLTRKGATDFVAALRTLPGVEAVGMTTNGSLLLQHLPGLVNAGLSALNISLDTLRPDRYQSLTGRDELFRVLEGVQRALDAGLRVKINCVVLEGVNDDEVPDLAALAEKWPVDVRFIEVMPLGAARAFRPVPGDELLLRLQKIYPDLAPETPFAGERLAHQAGGPARHYQSKALKGRLGLIDPISRHFCGGCNRVRLSSQGFLRLCLYHETGLDVRALLRGGATDGEIKAAMEAAILGKPEGHRFGGGEYARLNGLSTIGG